MSVSSRVAGPSLRISRFHQISEKLEQSYPLACGILAALAFAFNWATGHRGVFLLDQSMIFDGGWRILQGQTPYKDFLLPFGPVTFYIQAAFFKLFGVNWSATVLPACVFSSIATLCVIRIVRFLGGGSRVLALCGGLATAICFQAPFGTLWLEQTAMFFDLLALQAVVEASHVSGYRRSFWQLAGGLSLALAVLSKQNFGIFFVPVVLAVVVTSDLPDVRRACRSVSLVGVGVASLIAIFLGWVWLFSDFSSFVQRVLVVAGEIGRLRLNRWVIAKVFSFQITPNLFQFDLIGSLSGGVALFLAVFNFRGQAWREMAPACAAAILLPWYRSLTQATTLNDWENNLAFVGLAGCLGLSLLFRLTRFISIMPVPDRDVTTRLPSARTVKICLCVAAGIWGSVFLTYVGRAAWKRTVQGFKADAVFRDTIHVRGLERVRWGEPTSIGKTTVLRKADFENLVSYLSAKGAGFFVMGDATLLYGLLGTRPPQPLLYFQPSHSYLKEEIPRLDEVVSASLERNKIGVVVREKVTFLSVVHDSYSQFPRTWAWFTNHFDHVKDFGNFEIWERRPDGLR
jgi:hypothetical protein